MREKRIHLITLGCPKNQVDSEVLAAQLKANGFTLSKDVNDADIAVVNTCGFIDAAKQESIETILDVTQKKGSGKLKKVIVAGCLVERYKTELREGLRDVDAFYGTNQLGDILHEVDAEYKYEMVGDRVLSTPPHFAYLKISEGCDNPCSFCAIPKMRGMHVSRKTEDILHEAQLLAEKGVKELIVVGQDTTYYGLDIYGKRELPSLMRKLEEISGIEWIRLMYAYPAKFPDELLDVMSGSSKICKYIDIPIQHVADPVLKSMRRGITRRKLEELLCDIRNRVPGIAIRTTVIVGYPSEGEKEFEELHSFVKEFKFDRLGAFTYSVEDGTPAALLGDPVTQNEKEKRHAIIMESQREIIAASNAQKLGKEFKVLIDRKEGNEFFARTESDAPEIDPEVILTSGRELKIGTFENVKIDDSYEHDLYASVV